MTMRRLKVYNNKVLAGTLMEIQGEGYLFVYDDDYFNNPILDSISLTISKRRKIHKSPILFPFFANMLSEGENRALQAGRLKLDLDDDFGILQHTALYDTIGAITVKNDED